MDKQRQARAPLVIAIVLLLLPLLYVGSYLALKKPFAITLLGNGRNGTYVVADYRMGQRIASYAFYPLEQIDRKLRPSAWEPTGHGFELFEGLVSP
jgi:hypothetical protein